MQKKMNCSGCTNKPVATELIVKNGEKIEISYCEQCVHQVSIGGKGHASAGQVITSFVIAQSKAGVASAVAGECECCGLSFAEFRKEGVLGCSECYRAFEKMLSSLIERAQEGGTHHIGKIPRRAGASYDRQQRILSLRKQLAEAVASEQFERAALLRDEIRQFENGDRIDLDDRRTGEDA